MRDFVKIIIITRVVQLNFTSYKLITTMRYIAAIDNSICHVTLLCHLSHKSWKKKKIHHM